MQKLYQAYVYDVYNGCKRTICKNIYITKDGIVYLKHGINKQKMTPRTKIGKRQTWDYVDTKIYGWKKIEELMVATFLDTPSKGEEYKILKTIRIIYKNNNTKDYSLSNMKLCTFWEFAKWAHDVGVNITYSETNKLQVYEAYSTSNIGVVAFSSKYGIPRSKLYSIIKDCQNTLNNYMR